MTAVRGRFEVEDRDHKLTFVGRRLGHASSHRPEKHRWTEVDIFITDEDTYVVSSVGMSDVKKGDVIWDDRTETQVVAEADEAPYPWATVSVTAEGVVQCLYQYDADGIRYVTNVARRALAEAAEHDETLKKALAVEEVA